MSDVKLQAALSSVQIKKYKNDALMYRVTKLISNNSEEKEFDDILATISSIITFDYSDPDTSATNFHVAGKSATEQQVYNLRIWFAMYQNPY